MSPDTHSIEEVFAVAKYLADFPALWWIGGGWTIDLWIGNASREHEDIEICVARNDQETIYKYCAGWEFYTPVDNQWSLMGEGERLDASGFMLQLRRAAGNDVDIAEMPFEFEFILNDVTDGEWFYRFEPSIRLPLERIYRVAPLGLRVTAPEVILLHKAWYPPRPKDEHDFQRARNHLNSEQRNWLRQQLERIRPEHEWLSQLRT